MNQAVADLGGPCCGDHFTRAEQAEFLRELMLTPRYDWLFRDCPCGFWREEVEAERHAILAWARRTRMLLEVVQEYHFSQRQGDLSCRAHENAAEWGRPIRRSPPR